MSKMTEEEARVDRLVSEILVDVLALVDFEHQGILPDQQDYENYEPLSPEAQRMFNDLEQKLRETLTS
tara:strand:+ start:883 stop:1086 length:204 start_codon:yes stop_codon:yes gene_type:complete